MITRSMVWPSLVALAGIALLPLTVQAQDVHDRRMDQHSRIHQGVTSGSLTRREAYNIKTRSRRIALSARRDRALHGGHLTRSERARLNSRLNHNSHAIYRDKHNDHSR